MAETLIVDRAGDRRGNLVGRDRRCRGRGRRRARRLARMGGAFGRLPHARRCAASPTSSARARSEFADADRARDRQAVLGSADRGRRGHQQGRDFDQRLFRAHAAAEARGGARQQGRGAPQAAWRAGGARPYNFPAHLPNGHIVPALIAGNAVVFKPSEKTPATGAFLVECFHEAGIPEGVVRLLIGGPDEGRRWPPSRASTACCSPARPAPACRSTSSSPTRPHKILALELGGNNPIVVWDAKDIDAAATIVVQSAYLSAGQRCTAARRLIVEDGKEGPLLEAIEQADRPDHRRPAARRPAAVHGPGDRPRRRRPSPGAMARADDEGRQADPPARPPVRGAALS